MLDVAALLCVTPPLSDYCITINLVWHNHVIVDVLASLLCLAMCIMLAYCNSKHWIEHLTNIMGYCVKLLPLLSLPDMV